VQGINRDFHGPNQGFLRHPPFAAVGEPAERRKPETTDTILTAIRIEDDYRFCMERAAKYREIADNDDGWRRMQLLQVVQDLEREGKEA